MSDYIDLKVVGQVIGIGVLLGAGLPLLFSLGLRALSTGTEEGSAGVSSAAGSDRFVITKSSSALVLGVVLLVAVAAAVLFGVYTIINKS